MKTREIAADRLITEITIRHGRDNYWRNRHLREAILMGWDAAIEAAAKISENEEHNEDTQGWCVSRDIRELAL